MVFRAAGRVTGDHRDCVTQRPRAADGHQHQSLCRNFHGGIWRHSSVVSPSSFVEAFSQRFPQAPAPSLYRAPGRINLIGEHTDYNLGFVLPIALELACFTAVAPAAGGMLRVYSVNLGLTREIPVAELAGALPAKDWSDYVFGVAQQLVRAGYAGSACDLLVGSTVPTGGGLSSSAALEVSTALALLGGRGIGNLDLARLCQRAEREFVGMPCGIMDQYISIFGRQGAAVKIDCRSLEREYAVLPADVEIVAVNSMVKHELGSSAYRERVRECGEAVAVIQRHRPEAGSLRDVRRQELDEWKAEMDPVVFRRAAHVTSENERVEAFMEASRGGDLAGMGRLFVGSHRSLQHDYEVSCEELDFLVDTATGLPGVYGSRMTGGGFGGCTVNLVETGAVTAFEAGIAQAYRDRYGITPVFYQSRPAAGASQIG
ncbi:MAG: galactokinase [Acidobacteria bacterium]|nr:galactokinase [Acidobacteriota bacterium]